MLNAIHFLFRAEFLERRRRSHEWFYPICFYFILVGLFPFAFSADPNTYRAWVPGCIWISALFASLLSIEHLFSQELETGVLEQDILSDTPFALLVTIRVMTHWIMCDLPIILLTPLVGLMFGLKAHTITQLTLSLLIGTPMFVFIGALGIALTVGLKQQGVLLGLLVLPLLTPVLIFGVTIVQQAQAGFDTTGPLAFLAGLSLLTILFTPFAIAATLAISLDD